MSIFGQSSGSVLGSSQPQQTSSLFGTTSAQPTPSLFGSTLTVNSTQDKPSPFATLGNHTVTSQPQQSGSLFGGQGTQQQTSHLFGSSTQAQQSGSVLGGSLAPPQGSNLFRGTSQPQPTSTLFGGTSQPQQTSNPFGTSTQPQQPSGSLFGGLGVSTQQQQPQSGSVFGGSQQQQPSFGAGLTLGQSQSQPLQGSLLGQSQQPRLGTAAIWQPNGEAPRQKTIPEQMQLVQNKWDPQSSSCAFQYYFYNNVDKDTAPYYRPGPQDNEAKWEEALSKKPGPGAIPVLGKGFTNLNNRLFIQAKHLDVLQARLHEINNSLTAMLQNHDLVISIRAADARRKHVTLSQRSLTLATKVQILRNRGYAMDAAEEDLKKKLVLLERSVFDPALAGRGEEIWARMVGVRERARLLQDEFEKAGKGMANGQQDVIDEGTMMTAAKILDDYNAQLAHLKKEMTEIEKDFNAWQSGSKATSDGNSRVR
ncbi:MAG: hypothetical protein M1835_005231 [Candelina submexicana]|nr:MAG: hypothetical protein M1835_005231 [Candelina submexicana]